MRTIGKVLKESRVKKKISRANLEKKTKIKREFIKAIEEENWQELPDYPVIHGFVKSIANVFGLEESRVTALLRRDYPPKKLAVNPKPDISERFVWSPKLTFTLGVLGAFLLVTGYLVFQYLNFVKPPNLLVINPQEGEVVAGRFLEVSGRVDPDATIKINNQPVLTNDMGEFAVQIEISENTTEIVVKARSRSGKETQITRTINYRDQK